ncbi:hypothetical protein [Streptomyces acidiscabies]|uniref:hypothetical protein n=1 Tax=Streptomyces acidiscabies TaxID=42234 RepID=UPI0038F776CB
MVYARVESVVKNGSKIDITLDGGKVLHAPVGLFGKVKARMLADRRARSVNSPAGPDETLPGPCGSSYVTIGYQNTAARPYLMTTGFTVTPAPAISYDWWVQIDGPNGYAYDYEASGHLLSRWKWAGSHVGIGSFGRWSAMVDTLSWAVLNTGVVCNSAGPVDSHGL